MIRAHHALNLVLSMVNWRSLSNSPVLLNGMALRCLSGCPRLDSLVVTNNMTLTFQASSLGPDTLPRTYLSATSQFLSTDSTQTGYAFCEELTRIYDFSRRAFVPLPRCRRCPTRHTRVFPLFGYGAAANQASHDQQCWPVYSNCLTATPAYLYRDRWRPPRTTPNTQGLYLCRQRHAPTHDGTVQFPSGGEKPSILKL